MHNKASIVHRDLKPANVLFVPATRGRGSGGGGGGGGGSGGGSAAALAEDVYYPFTLKIADFGLSRSINASQSKFVSSAGAGTETWIPPEGLVSFGMSSTTTTYTFSYDVHPCGSLMYFILSGGEHAYGGNSPLQIQTNLAEGKHKRTLKVRRAECAVGGGESKTTATAATAAGAPVAQWERQMAWHLIDRMLQKDPALRPTPRDADKSLCMQIVLQHPFFMTSTEKLADIARGKDTNWQWLRGEVLKHRSGSALDWRSIAKLKAIQEKVQLEGQHYGQDLAELARLVRNTREHLQENATLQALFGVDAGSDGAVEMNDKVVHYVAAAMPSLLLFVRLIEWRWSVS